MNKMLLVLSMAALTGSALAHHSAAMFDMSKTVTVRAP